MSQLVISVLLEEDKLAIRFPYNLELVQLVRTLPGRRWDKANKTWTVARTHLSLVLETFRPYQLNIDASLLADEQPSRQITEAPSGFNGKLYPFQLEGVNFLISRRRCILGWEMGLGKTIAAIAALQHLRQEGRVGHALILTPKSVVSQWSDEIKRFSGESAMIVEGSASEKGQLIATSSALFTVTNYETAWLSEDAFRKRQQGYDCVVLDEAQRIGNYDTKTSKAVKSLFSSAAYKWALTGTPLMNRLEELHSIMSFVDEDILGSWWNFSNRYIEYEETGFGYKTFHGYKNLYEIHSILDGRWMLRRKKVEVLKEMPELMILPRYVEWKEFEREAYDTLFQKFEDNFDPVRDKGLALIAKFIVLRRACDSIFLVREHLGEIPESASRRPSSKTEELISVIDDIGESSKLVVFSEWTDAVLSISEALRTKGIGHVVFHGGLTSVERDEAKARFVADPEMRCFVSTDAGAYGLNLQASGCVINYDLPWSPAKIQQRIGRAHRIGQESKVLCLNLIHRGSIEDSVLRVLSEKGNLIAQVMEGSPVMDENGEVARDALFVLASLMFRKQGGAAQVLQGEVDIFGSKGGRGS